MRAVLLLTIFSIAAQAGAQQVYESVDPQGNVSFSDRPTADSEAIDVRPNVVETEKPPPATPRPASPAPSRTAETKPRETDPLEAKTPRHLVRPPAADQPGGAPSVGGSGSVGGAGGAGGAGSVGGAPSVGSGPRPSPAPRAR
jgi:hypothetical protein